MKKSALLLVLLGVLTSGFVGSNAMSAEATFTPVKGMMRYVVVDPGKQWIDDQGILHQRGARMTWELRDGEGDLVGTGSGVYNADINPTTGNGKTQGFHEFDLSFGKLSGSFSGHADNTITGGVMKGHYIGHGDGGFKGMKFRTDVTLVWGSGIAKYDGVIHDPKGK